MGAAQEGEPCEFIVYACPLGPLAEQIERYYAASLAACGPNAAHSYMAHCTLTGFFHDDLPSVAIYSAALDAALERARPTLPDPPLAITGVELGQQFHGLTLDSLWLKRLVADFAANAASPTRRDPIRLKDWLHLSLAYQFPPAQHEPLAALARAMVDITSGVSWELRFYERRSDGSWICHASWPLA